jgi:hypothetical protein
MISKLKHNIETEEGKQTYIYNLIYMSKEKCYIALKIFHINRKITWHVFYFSQKIDFLLDKV